MFGCRGLHILVVSLLSLFELDCHLCPLRLTVNLSSRKIPGLNVYAQMQNEKEQEMMSPANPTEATPSSQRDLVHSLEILDTEFNSRPIGEYPLLFDYLWLVFSLVFLHLLYVIMSSHVSSHSSCAFCSSEVKRSGRGMNDG